MKIFDPMTPAEEEATRRAHQAIRDNALVDAELQWGQEVAPGVTLRQMVDAHHGQGDPWDEVRIRNLLPGSCRLPRRFWARVVLTDDGHWVWHGYTASNGRPLFELEGRKRRNARGVAWAALKGPIPEGRFVVAACGTDLCVRPDHCLPVTRTEEGLMRRQPECGMGHALSGENLLVSCGKRLCRTCRRENKRDARAKARQR